METYHFGNNAYFVFKIDKDGDTISADIIWGKTDFRQVMKKKEQWMPEDLMILKNNKFYSFSKLTEHGVNNDEFLWVCPKTNEELFIELPKNIDKVIAKVCLEAIQKRGW